MVVHSNQLIDTAGESPNDSKNAAAIYPFSVGTVLGASTSTLAIAARQPQRNDPAECRSNYGAHRPRIKILFVVRYEKDQTACMHKVRVAEMSKPRMHGRGECTF